MWQAVKVLASKMDNLERSAAESEPNIDTDVIDKDRLLEARYVYGVQTFCQPESC